MDSVIRYQFQERRAQGGESDAGFTVDEIVACFYDVLRDFPEAFEAARQALEVRFGHSC